MNNNKDKFGGIPASGIPAKYKKKNTNNYSGGKTSVIILSLLLTVITLFFPTSDYSKRTVLGTFGVDDRLDIARGRNLFSATFFDRGLRHESESYLIILRELRSLTHEEIVPFIRSGKIYELEDEAENIMLGKNITDEDLRGIGIDPSTLRDKLGKIIDIEKRTRFYERVDAGEYGGRVADDENIRNGDRSKLRSWRKNVNQKKRSNFISDYIENYRTNETDAKSASNIKKTSVQKFLEYHFNLKVGGNLGGDFDLLFPHAIYNHPILFAIFVFSMMLIMAGGSLIFLKIAIIVIMNMSVKNDGRFKTGKRRNYTMEQASADGAAMTKSFIPIMLFSVKWGYLIHLFYFLSLLYLYDELGYLFPSFIIKWLMMPLIIIDM